MLSSLFGYLLLGKKFHIINDMPTGERVCYLLLSYYTTGEGLDEIQNFLLDFRKEIYENDNPMEIFYIDVLYAVILMALSKSTWRLLPHYSGLEPSLWSSYLKSQQATKMLWPAQQLIGENGILSGQSAVVQLPTGVGKTKASNSLFVPHLFQTEQLLQ